MFFLFLHICNRGEVEDDAWFVHRKGRFDGEEMRWKCEKYLRGGSICRIILVILQVKII